jgi:hypothetical protein
LGVIPSISSKWSVDEKHCPNFSSSSKSSMDSQSLETYIVKLSFRSQLYRRMYKSILGDTKKVVT